MCLIQFSEEDKQRLISECDKLPPNEQDYGESDPLRNCMIAVLDYQLQGKIVERAINDHFPREALKLGIEDLSTLDTFLDNEPSDELAAKRLWGYRYSYRLNQLRYLVKMLLTYKEKHGLSNDSETLLHWAEHTEFERGFEGHIKGLGYKVFKFTQQRVGVETAVPDIWTRRFVQRVTGKEPCDRCLVKVVNEVAGLMGVSRRKLDWTIWESEQKLGKTTERS